MEALVTNLDDVRRSMLVSQYLEVKRQIEDLEEQLKPLRSQLESIALEAPEFKARIGVNVVSLIECERETVALKEAKAALGDALNPFLKTSRYTQLRIK